MPGFQTIAGAMSELTGPPLPQPILSEAALVAGLACRYVTEIRKQLAVPILLGG